MPVRIDVSRISNWQRVPASLGMRVNLWRADGRHRDSGTIVAAGNPTDRTSCSHRYINNSFYIIGIRRDDSDEGGFHPSELSNLNIREDLSLSDVQDIWQCALRNGGEEYTRHVDSRDIYGGDVGRGYMTLESLNEDSEPILITNFESGSSEFAFGNKESKEASDMKLTSNDRLLVKLYYSKAGQRLLDIQVPAFIEGELRKGSREADGSSSSPGSYNYMTLVSKSWRTEKGKGLKIYRRIVGLDSSSYVNGMISRHNYQIDAVGMNFGIRNISILRAVGIGKKIITWDMSNLKILDEDILKWADNLNKSIVSYIKNNLSEKKKRFKIKTSFIEL